jgi:hypothetical protein
MLTFILNVNELDYGKKNDELKIGEGLEGIVNAINDNVFLPWHRNVENDVTWGKYNVEFNKMLTLRDKPKTYHIILVNCEPINKNDPKISWIYRDDRTDGYLYKKLVLQNGEYLIGYKISEKSIYIKSLKR